MRRALLPMLSAAALLVAACQRPPPPAAPAVKPNTLVPNVVKSHPHQRQDFIQGLVVHDGTFIESTGLKGKSALIRKRIADGVELQRVGLDAQYFGEGCAVHGDRIYQLTWMSGICLVYNLADMAPVDAFKYEGEGWGLSSDGERLIMSDGGSTIVFRDPATFAVTRKLDVTYEGRPLPQLNELEWIDGHVYANVWQTSDIVVIDPESGAVVTRIDCAALVKRATRLNRDAGVLNGIAWDPATGHLFLTGKKWPVLFEVELPAVAE